MSGKRKAVNEYINALQRITLGENVKVRNKPRIYDDVFNRFIPSLLMGLPYLSCVIPGLRLIYA